MIGSAGGRGALLLMLCLTVSALLLACGGDDEPSPPPTVEPSPTTGGSGPGLSLTSDAFGADEPIPARFTCDGENISPALTWVGAPENAQSIALVMDDPDAPGGTFTHWLIYNMSAGARGLLEDVEKTERPDNGVVGLQGRNDFGDIGYGGPCPPEGETHRYEFRLYAVDDVVDLAPGASKEELLASMEGRMLAVTTLTGTYERSR